MTLKLVNRRGLFTDEPVLTLPAHKTLITEGPGTITTTRLPFARGPRDYTGAK